MNALNETLFSNSAVKSIFAAYKKAQSKNCIYGVAGAAKHAIVAACFEKSPRPLLIAAPDAAHVKAWRENLAALLPSAAVSELPETDVAEESAFASGEVSAASRDLSARRLSALGALAQNEAVIVLAAIPAAAQLVIGKRDFLAANLAVKVGQAIGRKALLEKLVAMGYEPAAEVERIGEYSVRGSIVDIFPINAENPLRIEFFDVEIDSLRSFAVETKISRHNLSEAAIMPLHGGAAKAENLLLSYLGKGAAVIFDEPARLAEELNKRRKENPDLAKFYAAWEDLLAFGGAASSLYISLLPQRLANVELNSLISLTARQIAAYRRQYDLLAEDVRAWQQRKARILFAASSADKAQAISNILNQYKIAHKIDNAPAKLAAGGIVVSNFALSEGFELPDAGLIVITEAEVFGQRKRAAFAQVRASQREAIKSHTDIKIGDYVVHINHGIGRYVGIKTMEVHGLKRDYIFLQYGGTDKLFVPTDQVGQLQKYIGAEGETPKLTKLNTTEWSRARARAKKSVEDIAAGLIKLYAEREAAGGIAFLPDTPWQQEFEESFSYAETPDQLKAIAEIKADMERPKPMERLLCGDVGFGKTEVAVRAAFKAVMSGYQVAVLVPTTVLAQQHYQTFSERFGNFGPEVDVICRFRTAKEQRRTAARLAAGQVDVLIGTHALLNKNNIAFKKLGLLIIDEEQRFGVKQKEKIKALSKGIDVLALSATPIPRTLHMSLAGARDMSLIETPPAERYPIQTYVAEESDELIATAIKRELKRGGQVYFIYNRVRTIERMAEKLAALVPEARIEIGHGQMNEDLLESVMMRFYEGKSDVLLASSIVENGLDVANANTLIVYDADYFGLSQLYQMRGRVGRSARLAFAYFLYRRDKIITEAAEKRLMAMKEFAELGAGFRIAMRDLELRGAGNLLGAEQHGHIAGVGFEMYCQLLDEAVAALRGGQKIREMPDPVLNLKVEAYIDGGYIADAMHKIEVYQRLAAVRNEKQLSLLLDELIDRFGEPTTPVLNLLAVARLKNRARELDIKSIVERDDKIAIEFLPNAKVKAENIIALINNRRPRARLLRGEPLLYIAPTMREKDNILKFLLSIMDELSA